MIMTGRQMQQQELIFCFFGRFSTKQSPFKENSSFGILWFYLCYPLSLLSNQWKALHWSCLYVQNAADRIPVWY